MRNSLLPALTATALAFATCAQGAATGGRYWTVYDGAIDDPIGCEDQFRNAFLMGCVGAWSLHPSQIEIAKRVIAAMPDGSGTVMLEGKMQDDATFKQCKVMVTLAELIASRDPGLAKLYEL